MSFEISSSALALTIAAFLVSRAAGGVIGEYAKRFWFKVLEPLLGKILVKPITAAIGFARPFLRPFNKQAVELALDGLEREHARLNAQLTRVLEQNDALLAENIRLRVVQGADEVAS